MANLTITPASVIRGKGTKAKIENGLAGETLTAGQPYYLKGSDSRFYAAVATNGTARKARGITLNGGAAGQPIAGITGGPLTAGAALAVGTVYALSATAGMIAPLADLVSTNFVVVLGIATTAAILQVAIWDTGVQVA